MEYRGKTITRQRDPEGVFYEVQVEPNITIPENTLEKAKQCVDEWHGKFSGK